MEPRMTQGEQNLLLLESVIPGGEKLYVWCFDDAGKIVASSCPKEDEALLSRSLSILGAKDKAKEMAKNAEQKAPFLLGSPIGMQWAVTFETERKRSMIFVIGPVAAS